MRLILPACLAIALSCLLVPGSMARDRVNRIAPVQTLPDEPFVVRCKGSSSCVGKRGGTLNTLIARPKDVRMMTIYGYARLMQYTPALRLEPDILKKVDVERNRVFTLHLRKGHRWSDGAPLTAEDFRYTYEDVYQNKTLSPAGLPMVLMVNGKAPTFEVLDKYTVRYSWEAPNPLFLPALAAARPLYLYKPAHYLKHFHIAYTDKSELDNMVAEEHVRGWANMHMRMGRQYKPENPDLPSLQPWVNTTHSPSSRYVFRRNPYYHRVDEKGTQLPYIDEVVLSIVENQVIAAKVGTGESDLQERYLRFDDFTFLRAASKRNDYQVDLWQLGSGSAFALYPNLNAKDEVWRHVLRDRRFRQALSLGIYREEINQVLFYGLATPSANTVLPESPLYKPELRDAFTKFDLKAANALLDEMGLRWNKKTRLRTLPDGRSLTIVVESAGENTLDADILSLIAESWQELGIELLTRSSQRDLFRRRVQSGEAIMSAWTGVNNGLPTPVMPPTDFIPSEGSQLQWPLWGQHMESRGKVGRAINYPPAQELLKQYKNWTNAANEQQMAAAWSKILDIHAREVFSIGVLNGHKQPVVYSNKLHNLPKNGILSFTPTSYFGVYKPDQFWLETE